MTTVERLTSWILEASTLLSDEKEPTTETLPSFIEAPELVDTLVQMLSAIDEKSLETDQALYSACLLALDICVSQLHFSSENGNRAAHRSLDNLMLKLVEAMRDGKQSINFWLPVMSVFYEAKVELSQDLQDIYLALAEEESDRIQLDDFDHLQSMKSLIEELGEVSAFELASHFFAQSHAMPAEFFSDLVADLCSLKEGEDAAILTLLHPNPEVREVVLFTLDTIIPKLTLSAESLARLQAIAGWMPEDTRQTVMHWIRQQRKKGVVFPKPWGAQILKLQASEIDGGGAQGLFLQLKRNQTVCLAGVLVKGGFGIKDAWVTPGITHTEALEYYHQVFDDGVMLRKVDLNYLNVIVNHSLALTLALGQMPSLHFLEMQELLGMHFVPEPLDIPLMMNELSVQIEPFTPDTVERALKHSKDWLVKKRFAGSWYIENEHLDKLVNRCSSIKEGMKLCRVDEAEQLAFEHEFEAHRAHWLFHFLWVALWLRAGARKNEKVWQECFLIAHAIHSGMPLRDIPIMQSICRQSIVNSVETMRERRTHLS